MNPEQKAKRLEELQQEVRDASEVDDYQSIIDELRDIERDTRTGNADYADWASRSVSELLNEAQEDVDEVRENEGAFSKLSRKLTGKKLHAEGWTEASIEELLVEASYRLISDLVENHDLH